MKTVIKIPLYVEVTTEEGLNRKTISDGIRDYLIPEFLKFAKTNFVPDVYLSSRNNRNLRIATGDKSRFRLLSNSDLFLGGNPENNFTL